MNIHLFGTSHHHSELALRERLVFRDEEIPDALASLRRDLASEAAIVSTCNRTELYVVPESPLFDPESLRLWLAEWKGTQLPRSATFSLQGATAARHLFDVASGVDSQVIGDIQILGQIRAAWQSARGSDALGKLLDRLFTSALHTGKRVRTETELFSGAVSISYAAVELARKIFHPISRKRTLVIGAGSTGELAARNLRDQGVEEIHITNRTEERGRALIERLGFGRWLPFEELRPALGSYDIVIVSTGAPYYLITYDDAREATSRREGEPLLIVDISLPRNVDPRIDTLSNVFCKDLNDLTSVVESNLERRREELPRAERIIEDELNRFVEWCHVLPVTPVIAQLKERAGEIVREEIERNRGRFDPEQLPQIERLVSSVVRRLISLPMGHLLDVSGDLDHVKAKAEYVRLLFNLDTGEERQEEEGEEKGELVPLRRAGGDR